MVRIIKNIKNALVARKAQQEQIRRQAHNREQVRLILQGLEERGY